MSADLEFFTEHSVESAPPAARRYMTATRDQLGYLPAGMARMAASPQLVDGFMKLTAIFGNTALEPLAREVVVMTVATRNRCHICVAMHTAMLTGLGADPGLIAALREEDRAEPLPDERLDAIRGFTLRVLDTAGDVGDQALRDFLAAGYTTQNALEVVLGIGAYTMSTLANRLTGAPVDDQLAAYAWALSCGIVRGRFQSATLSYAAFAAAAGRGYMSEGLALVLRYAFCELRLHRLEANIQPGNEASLRLVARMGFRKEGYSPAMLFIDGDWRDHERWAITRETTDFPPVDPHPTLPAR
jgi:AhpD family alkylhydroperoxidase